MTNDKSGLWEIGENSRADAMADENLMNDYVGCMLWPVADRSLVLLPGRRGTRGLVIPLSVQYDGQSVPEPGGFPRRGGIANQFGQSCEAVLPVAVCLRHTTDRSLRFTPLVNYHELGRFSCPNWAEISESLCFVTDCSCRN